MSAVMRWSLFTLLGLVGAGCCKLAQVGMRPESGLTYSAEGKFDLQMGENAVIVAEARGTAPCLLYSSVDRPSAFRWTSSDTSVATVSAHGVVHGVRLGETVIIATTKDHHGRVPITVVPADSAPSDRLTFAAADERLCG